MIYKKPHANQFLISKSVKIDFQLFIKISKTESKKLFKIKFIANKLEIFPGVFKVSNTHKTSIFLGRKSEIEEMDLSEDFAENQNISI